jgi:hypothetical protein
MHFESGRPAAIREAGAESLAGETAGDAAPNFSSTLPALLDAQLRAWNVHAPALAPEETENPLGGYGKTLSHVILGLKTAKGTKTLRLDPSIYDGLQKERGAVGGVPGGLVGLGLGGAAEHVRGGFQAAHGLEGLAAVWRERGREARREGGDAGGAARSTDELADLVSLFIVKPFGHVGRLSPGQQRLEEGHARPSVSTGD